MIKQLTDDKIEKVRQIILMLDSESQEDKWNIVNNIILQLKVRIIKCPTCNKEFTTKASNNKYCSNKCNKKGRQDGDRNYYLRNIEKRKRQMSEYAKGYYIKNKDKISRNNKSKYINNKINVSISNRVTRVNKREELNNYHKQRYNNDANFRKLEIIRGRTRYHFKHLMKVCEDCGNNKKDDLIFHHLLPLFYDNFVIICKSCHMKRHDRELII